MEFEERASSPAVGSPRSHRSLSLSAPRAASPPAPAMWRHRARAVSPPASAVRSSRSVRAVAPAASSVSARASSVPASASVPSAVVNASSLAPTDTNNAVLAMLRAMQSNMEDMDKRITTSTRLAMKKETLTEEVVEEIEDDTETNTVVEDAQHPKRSKKMQRTVRASDEEIAKSAQGLVREPCSGTRSKKRPVAPRHNC